MRTTPPAANLQTNALQAVVDNVADAIIIVDASGTILYKNPAAADLI